MYADIFYYSYIAQYSILSQHLKSCNYSLSFFIPKRELHQQDKFRLIKFLFLLFDYNRKRNGELIIKI